VRRRQVDGNGFDRDPVFRPISGHYVLVHDGTRIS
jgi:hypothetical protein